MCGRYTITISFEEMMHRFAIDGVAPPYHKPRYNVAPFQHVPAIVGDGRRNRIGELRWGLVPSWAKDDKIGSKMINARAETLMEKASFRPLLSRKRCIIPADSFYEWQTVGGKKRPLRIMLKDGAMFSMAGLYDIWEHTGTGERLSTCTVITTEPNRLVAPIHNRMPVILAPKDEAAWLDRNNGDVTSLLSLLKPYDADRMYAYPVSDVVNKVQNETEECIRQVEADWVG